MKKGLTIWELPWYYEATQELQGEAQPHEEARRRKIADPKSKTAWERENVIQVVLKINRNQDPELFQLLQQAESKSGTVRALLRQAISKDK